MKRIVLLLILFSIAVGVVGCSGGSGGSNPAEGSNWDEMHWDQGQWA